MTNGSRDGGFVGTKKKEKRKKKKKKRNIEVLEYYVMVIETDVITIILGEFLTLPIEVSDWNQLQRKRKGLSDWNQEQS